MVTQVPTLWKAAYNMMLLSPRKRAYVPGMAVMYNDIRRKFPDAPFFYLSTSQWNVESSIRNFILDYGFPDGPLLLRDLDPRPKTFVPSGVQHKLEYAEQLMEDFPDMKFILLGDDGQNDIRRMFPDAPFFYLSTSPWNVESSIRNFILDYGFPDGPLLLRDLDPRPKTFVPSGVQHKLEYAEQLMEDFPDMKFILLGDDGQKDPSTYAEIAKRYPGRVLAIGRRAAHGGLPRHEVHPAGRRRAEGPEHVC